MSTPLQDSKATTPVSTTGSVDAVRWLLVVGTLACATSLTWGYYQIIAWQGVNLAEFIALIAFFVLALWISLPFCSCLVGFWSILRRRPVVATLPTCDELPRTAILVPVYNESPKAVFSAIVAMARSLEQLGREQCFEFFVLSDTQREDVWLEEEAAWTSTSELMPASTPLFYRRRERNVGKKAGNIADFVSRWGGRYELMVVLDADSVMDGRTLLQMTGRAAADKTIGILQVPPKPVGRRSLLARILQFSADVYGPVFLAGYKSWTGSDGNYFGHNAIIRTDAFAQHCNLPVLSGPPPLGGHILSHDFVEAALIRRAGYKVVTADDLDGSYEECPTTLLDYAIRDQRWCQGNLQHARLLGARGLHPVSRFHFLNGLLSYVSSVVWILFIVAMAAGVLLDGNSSSSKAAGSSAMLFFIVFAMLLAPKFLAIFSLRTVPGKVAQLGGWMRVIASVGLEIVLGMLLAPILAFYHATFVITTTVFGKSVQWNSQSRDERTIPFRELARLHRWQTLSGILLPAGSFAISTPMGLWCLPLSLGLVLSAPLSYALGSQSLGDWLGQRSLLLIPEERSRPKVLQLRDAALHELDQAPARPSSARDGAEDSEIESLRPVVADVSPATVAG